MSHLKIANELKGQKLTPLEREVVIGCLLGDGTLSKSGKEYRLRIEHKAAHRGYVDWKYRQLQRFCVTPPQFISQHQSCRFGTVGHPELTEYATFKRLVKPYVDQVPCMAYKLP